MISNIADACNMFLKVLNGQIDPDKRETAYELKDHKDTDKAMEAAETFFRVSRTYINKNISLYKFKLLLNKYEKLFFKYN